MMVPISNSTLRMRRLLGPIRQIGFVTANVRAAALSWASAFGIGPWLILDPFPVEEFSFLGEKQDILLAVAVSFSGELQLEFIQQYNDVPSAYQPVISSKVDPVMHHGCYFPEDYRSAYEALKAVGYIPIQEGGGRRGRFAYFIHKDGEENFVEIAERSNQRMQGFSRLHRICEKWNGKTPLRTRI